MPVSEQSAASLLAEFIAKRGAVPVLKSRKAANKPEQRDKLEKVEFAPDNSRIGCESRGCSTDWRDLDTLAAIWVYEWHTDLKHEPIKFYVPIAPVIQSKPFVIVREAEQTTAIQFAPPSNPVESIGVTPEWLRAKLDMNPLHQGRFISVNNNAVSTRTEQQSWRKTRQPKTGQRPQVSR